LILIECLIFGLNLKIVIYATSAKGTSSLHASENHSKKVYFFARFYKQIIFLHSSF